MFELALGGSAPDVGVIATADRPSPAQRPLRGTMDTSKLERVFGVSPRSWREALADIVADLRTEQKADAA